MINGVISDFLYKVLPSLLSIGLGMVLYFFVDKNFNITDWISKRIKTNDEWKPLISFLFVFFIVFILGLTGIYVVDMPSIQYFIICGLLTGIGIGYITNFNAKRKNIRK